jgi:hypothetical protein
MEQSSTNKISINKGSVNCQVYKSKQFSFDFDNKLTDLFEQYPFEGGGELASSGSTGAIGSEGSPIPSRGYPDLGEGRPELTRSPLGGMGEACHRHRLPSGHRFFADGERETMARFIDWSLRRSRMAKEGAWFTTLTFKNYVSPYRGNKMVRRWLARVSQALDDNGGRQLKSILVTEWQRREVIHYHLLLTGHGLDTLSRKRWECRWTALGGGFARVYDADLKAAPYLAKYMNKRLGGEVDIGGAWQGIVTPRSVSVRTDTDALASRL